MKQYLLDIYNEHKKAFVETIANELKAKGNKVAFSPYIHIDLPILSNDNYEEITEIEYDPKESTWYVHNFITDIDMATVEYWTPLHELSFDELFQIAEKL